MNIIDFAPLTDDQLVALIRAAAQEAIRRGDAVKTAAQNATLSEAEKAKIARDAAHQEEERLRQQEAEQVAREAAGRVSASQRQKENEEQYQAWGKKKTLAHMVIAVLGTGWELAIWERNGDRRVYFDCTSSRVKITYFDTGNRWHPPASVDGEASIPRDAKPFVLKIAHKACSEWPDLRLNCDVAAAAQVEVAANLALLIETFFQLGERRKKVDDLSTQLIAGETELSTAKRSLEFALEVAASHKKVAMHEKDLTLAQTDGERVEASRRQYDDVLVTVTQIKNRWEQAKAEEEITSVAALALS